MPFGILFIALRERFRMKKKNAVMGLVALFVGIASMPIAAFGSWIVGCLLMFVPMYLVYKAD